MAQRAAPHLPHGGRFSLSRARNAEDFLQEYRRIRFQYDAVYRPRIEAIRVSYSDNPAGSTPPSVDNALEAHMREYVINAFLRAELEDGRQC
jgi:hypothetical protein